MRIAGWEFRFGILENPARYPSGPRERSAKPPFVGSNPTRASNVFTHLAPLYDDIPQPYAELFVMNADGSGQRPLTDNQW